MTLKNWARGKRISKIALVLTILLSLTLLFQPARAFAASSPVSPTSGLLGSVFTINGSGFTPNEKLNLHTVDPSYKTLGAGYIFADTNGNFMAKVHTTDPEGLAADEGTNYTHLVTIYKSDGTVDYKYLDIILFKPALGNWTLSATGVVSTKVQGYSFTVVHGSTVSITSTVSPTSGTRGTVFTLKAQGFQSDEKVNLWTTDPSGKALSAGYMIADTNGDIQIRVHSYDHNQVTADDNTNYTELITVYNSDGTVAYKYLQLVLYNSTNGNWSLTAQSALTEASTVFNFTIQ